MESFKEASHILSQEPHSLIVTSPSCFCKAFLIESLVVHSVLSALPFSHAVSYPELWVYVINKLLPVSYAQCWCQMLYVASPIILGRISSLTNGVNRRQLKYLGHRQGGLFMTKDTWSALINSSWLTNWFNDMAKPPETELPIAAGSCLGYTFCLCQYCHLFPP